MSDTDLWNQPIGVAKEKRTSTKPKGHAGIPGTGPKGETCKSCRHLARLEFAKTYLKCGLMRNRWTGGPGTDVRAKDPACWKWEAIEKSPQPQPQNETNKDTRL